MDLYSAPRKAKFRQRAHSNPLVTAAGSAVPRSPHHVDWTLHFPDVERDPNSSLKTPWNTLNFPVSYGDDPILSSSGPTILDIGCGFGGLSLRLSELLPEERILGMELRDKVAEFVGRRILSARQGNLPPGFLAGGKENPVTPDGFIMPRERKHNYLNVSVLKQNAMRDLLHLISQQSISKLAFCFPDPHFKRANWRRRIVNRTLIGQYLYILKPGGRIYTVTDCYELHKWCVSSLAACEELERLYESEPPQGDLPRHAYDPDAARQIKEAGIKTAETWKLDFGPRLEGDPVPGLLGWATEESQKVIRNGMCCFISVFEKRV